MDTNSVKQPATYFLNACMLAVLLFFTAFVFYSVFKTSLQSVFFVFAISVLSVLLVAFQKNNGVAVRDINADIQFSTAL